VSGMSPTFYKGPKVQTSRWSDATSASLNGLRPIKFANCGLTSS